MATLSGASPKTVGDPTDAYLSLKPIWEKNHAICGGERYVKAKDRLLDLAGYTNLLIPFSPSMSQRQYDFYKAEAELPGIVSQFAKMLIGSLLRKQPSLTLAEGISDEAKDWIMEEFGMDGAPITAFLREALWEEMKTDATWVYVGYPKIEGAADLTRGEREKYKPAPVLWNAEMVINVRTEIDDFGQQILRRIIVRGYQEDYPDEDTFHPELVETLWVHELNPEGYYQIRIFSEASKSEVETINGAKQRNNTAKHFLYRETADNILKNGERLTFIPAWPLNGNYAPNEPFLTPLVDKEVALYNKISRRNHLLYGAATYTPWVASDMTDGQFDDFVSNGLGAWLNLEKDDKVGILQTPSDALEDMERTVASAIEEMARLGIRIMSPETQQSGVALMIRNAAQTAQLGTLNLQTSNTMRQVIAFMLEWRYGKDVGIADVTFKMSSDFEAGQIGADWLRLATEWYEAGLIPRKIWLSLLQQNDMLPSEYDDEEGQEEINADDLIVKEESAPSLER